MVGSSHGAAVKGAGADGPHWAPEQVQLPSTGSTEFKDSLS